MLFDRNVADYIYKIGSILYFSKTGKIDVFRHARSGFRLRKIQGTQSSHTIIWLARGPFTFTASDQQRCNHCLEAGVGKVRPAGQIRPASSVDPACQL